MRIDDSGPLTRRCGGGRRREFFDLVDLVSGREVRIRASELGTRTQGLVVCWWGAVSGDCALNQVSKSVFGLFYKGLRARDHAI